MNNRLQVPSKILAKLRCTLCNEYLSQFPVYLYPGQGAVCGRCPLLDEQNFIRDEAYENVAAFLLFPCRHQPQGCLEQLIPTDIQAHEESCIFRTYFCPSVPLGICPWQGPSSELLAHYEEKHAVFVLKDSAFEVDFVSKYDENYLLPFGEHLFLVHTKSNSSENMYWCSVRCIGPKSTAEEYQYKIILLNGTGNEKVEFEYKQVESDVGVNLDKTTAIAVNTNNMKIALRDPLLIVCKVVINKIEETSDPIIELSRTYKTSVSLEGVDENMLRNLECPVCNEYMVPPINQCITGHSICGTCKEQVGNECPECRGPIQDTRNYTLENMTSFLKYTCKYRDNDCPFVCYAAEIRQHEAECIFGPYNCPFRDYNSCSWKGKLTEVMEHARLSHEDNIIDLDIVNFPFENNEIESSDYEDEDCFLLTAYGNIFKLIFKYERRNFYWSAQFVGPSREATNYMFELDLIDYATINQRLFIKRPVVALCSNNEAFNDDHSYIIMPIELVSPMIIDKILTFKVRIVKS